MMNIQKWLTQLHYNCYPKLDVIGSTIYVPSLILTSKSPRLRTIYSNFSHV